MTTPDITRSRVSGYEALRGGALGEPVAPELRSGLAVLLRRGLWAWFGAVSAEYVELPRRPSDIAQPRNAGVLVHLLADLASARSGRST